jgi:hypothetical protein
MEAELRELQEALKQSALEGAFQPTAPPPRPHSEGESSDDGWQDTRPARRSTAGGDADASGASTGRIVVHNLAADLDRREVWLFFKQ